MVVFGFLLFIISICLIIKLSKRWIGILFLVASLFFMLIGVAITDVGDRAVADPITEEREAIEVIETPEEEPEEIPEEPISVEPEPEPAPAPAPVIVEPKAEPQSITVYVTNTGEKYHLSGCRYLSKSKIPIALGKAKSSGYTPCSVCKPPR